VAAFYASPVITALAIGSGRRPSYIPSQHFVRAVLGEGRAAVKAGETAASAYARVGQEIAALPVENPAKGALLAIHGQVSNDVNAFRREAEGWFDDCMERLSGKYRRFVQYVVWGLSALVVI